VTCEHVCSWLLFCFTVAVPVIWNALFLHVLLRCQVYSGDGHDAVYLEQLYFNKLLLGQYNSTLGKFTGYTEFSKPIADSLNNSTRIMEQERKNTWRNCRDYVQLKPHVRLRSVEAGSSRHPAMLVCSAYGFYPKQIRLTWLRNGKEVTSDVTSTEELPNGNWLYQIHSQLEYTPRPGEKIICMVEHASLMDPELYDWVPMMPESKWNKIALGTAGLLLGLVLLVAGLIYYRKKSSGERQDIKSTHHKKMN
uniref:Ig-like domain-containing protein n=1 Tax=Myripristis murdjan TaxID=586833 RepID=A0A667XGT8_9TELE